MCDELFVMRSCLSEAVAVVGLDVEDPCCAPVCGSASPSGLGTLSASPSLHDLAKRTALSWPFAACADAAPASASLFVRI